jgi:hypothetical protein
MKKNIFWCFIICATIQGCKKEVKPTYQSADNIYLNYGKADNPTTDSIIFSFALTPGLERDTIWVPVIISGKTTSHDRKFNFGVVEGSSSTAVRNLHFEPLKPFYIMPADSGTVKIPVVIKNIDTALVNKSVFLTVRVSGGEDFKTELPEYLRSKRIFFSNRLEEPAWWKDWGQLGKYSRIKHQLFLISSGTQDLVQFSKPNYFLEIPRDLYYIANTHEFLTYPFDWVKNNPQRGYVLTMRNNGTGDYDFYNIAAPTKKFWLKYFKSANTYVFIDENNDQVII